MLKRLFPVILISAMLAVSPFLAFAADGKDISVRTSVDRKAILIGDRIKFTIEIAAAKGTVVELPKFAGYSMGPFEIKETGERMKSGLFGLKRYTKWFDITTYSAGTATIPEIEIKYRTKTMKDSSAKKTKPIEIIVLSVLPKGQEPADIKDIKGPVSIRNPYWGIVALALALFMAVAITLIVYKHFKRYVPVRLPHETALEELEYIRAAYLQGGDIKIYYVDVSDCVRRYIEHGFKLKAPEMTTEEFLDSLRDSGELSTEHKDLLKGFLNACDMVKFAKYAPSHSEAQALYTSAKSFIEETKGALKNVRI